MTLISERTSYSYRSDPSVPTFDDQGPVAFMDGSCALCSNGARLIAHFDHSEEFKICPTQSNLGVAILKHYGLRYDDPETWLYLENGDAFTSMDAMIRAGKRLGGPGRLLVFFRILPRTLQDWVYRRIARNRYMIFGRTDICKIPDTALQDRLIG